MDHSQRAEGGRGGTGDSLDEHLARLLLDQHRLAGGECVKSLRLKGWGCKVTPTSRGDAISHLGHFRMSCVESVPGWSLSSEEGRRAPFVHRMKWSVKRQGAVQRKTLLGHPFKPPYKDTSLVRNTPPVGPYSSPVPRNLW